MEYKLKDLIERVTVKNNTQPELLTQVIDVYDGILDRPSRDASGSNRLGSYQVVEPYQLVLGTPALNRRLQCAINLSDQVCIANIADIVFSVNKTKVLPEYMHMYLNTLALRPDIKARLDDRKYNFTIEDLLEVTIEIPTLPTQRKYLGLHQGFLQALDTTRQGLEQIKTTCDQAIDLIKGRRVKLKNYICLSKETVSLDTAVEKGFDYRAFFEEPVCTDPRLQKHITIYEDPIYDQTFLVPQKGFYYKNAFAQGKWQLHFHDGYEGLLVPTDNHIVFTVKNDKELYPDFLFMELNTSEALAYFKEHAIGTGKIKKLSFSKLGEFKIELPDFASQVSLSALYKVYTLRKEAYDGLVNEFQNFCAVYCLDPKWTKETEVE